MDKVDRIWLDVQSRLRNSVVQIMVTQGDFDLSQPFVPPGVRNAVGSGFIVSSEGHIITNAHVVANMLTLSFRTEQSGGLDLRANLIAICIAKDVALLKCDPQDLSKLGAFEPLRFGDDQKLSQMQNVMVAGYPLGRRLTFTGGVVSGYEAPDGDASETSQSYIQIDAPLNPGNSGGPLITLEGLVVGINSAGIPSAYAQNTNFAIPSRVVMSIMRDLFAREKDPKLKKVVTPPSLGLTTQRVTLAHYKWAGAKIEDDYLGVMVKDVIRGTTFGALKNGDILRAIKFADPYTDSSAFDLSTYRTSRCLRCEAEPDVEIEIQRTGLVKLFVRGEESNYTKDRRVSIQEIMDTIPTGMPISLEIMRKDSGIYDVHGTFENKESLAIVKVHPPFDNLDYLIFGGVVWVQLSANIINALGDTKYISDYVPFEKRYDHRVILTVLYPLSEMKDLGDINPTETLETLNGKKISTLDDMRGIIMSHFRSKSTEPWRLSFRSGKLVILDKITTIKKDIEIHQTFKISPGDFSKELFSKLK